MNLQWFKDLLNNLPVTAGSIELLDRSEDREKYRTIKDIKIRIEPPQTDLEKDHISALITFLLD